MKKIRYILLTLLWTGVMQATTPAFRGVWIATVANIDWPSTGAVGNPEKQQQEMLKLLDSIQALGMNAVIFQIRPTADAVYQSELEPWSHWLTGQQGFWCDTIHTLYDPLEFVTTEAHERGLAVHAWLNPYRVTIGKMDTVRLAPNHLMRIHPDWFWQYGDQWYFEPGLDETRDWICMVVEDVVCRYDVDAVHMDDYFYPYPLYRTTIPDAACFMAHPRGFTDIKAWRRNNVNMAIEAISTTIHQTKPWVEFGISPFGVWRNHNRDTLGSMTTAGLTNYDHLYADVLHWIGNGWIDYIIPQLYWEIGRKAADYSVLAHWWADAVARENEHALEIGDRTCKLYIGLAPYRLGREGEAAAWHRGNEIVRQMDINRTIDLIEGECFYSAKPLLKNPLHICDSICVRYHAH